MTSSLDIPSPTASVPMTRIQAQPRHYVYVLRFHEHADAYKVGISDPVDLRVRQLSSVYGPCDLTRSLTVATHSRGEAEKLERTIFLWHEQSRHNMGENYALATGHSEWLRMDSLAEVLATIEKWIRLRPGRCRFVPIGEAIGEGWPEERQPATLVTPEERRQQFRARRLAQETGRRRVNELNLRITCQTIEDHLPYLRRVHLRPVSSSWMVGSLLFRGGTAGCLTEGGFAPEALAARFARHRDLTARPGEWYPHEVPLTDGHRIFARAPSGRYGLRVHLLLNLRRLNVKFTRETPELEFFLRWLHVLRARVREQRRRHGGRDQLTLPFGE